MADPETVRTVIGIIEKDVHCSTTRGHFLRHRGCDNVDWSAWDQVEVFVCWNIVRNFNIMMYASPLTVMKRVIKTKSVKYMPFSLSLANFANGIVWSIYALIKLDPFVLVPNGLGTLSGLVQLVLFATYYRTTKWGDEEDTNKQEIELQKSAETGQDGQP
ncbi:UNVERIFIED_CONTAM: Bidirectional sugar transporter SWEET5 [Sesamum angustifolium]|uniref:Bidirectional sugar transporter SWEET5 n=1 Tax=Sesamum angustifolium TaxID=2727405 RepID=A0AAW2KM51_9LAMI